MFNPNDKVANQLAAAREEVEFAERHLRFQLDLFRSLSSPDKVLPYFHQTFAEGGISKAAARLEIALAKYGGLQEALGTYMDQHAEPSK